MRVRADTSATKRRVKARLYDTHVCKATEVLACDVSKSLRYRQTESNSGPNDATSHCVMYMYMYVKLGAAKQCVGCSDVHVCLALCQVWFYMYKFPHCLLTRDDVTQPSAVTSTITFHCRRLIYMIVQSALSQTRHSSAVLQAHYISLRVVEIVLY